MFGSKTRKNFSFYLAFHIARYIFRLVITPFLANKLMKDGFGQYAVINSCVWSAAIFIDFGFYIYGINRIAAAEDDMAAVSREASAIVSAKLALLPLFLIAYSILITGSGQIWRSPAASVLGAISGISIGGTFSWYFQGRQRGGTAVMIESVPQVFQTALLLLLIRSPSDLWMAILILAVAPMLSISLSIFLAYREGLRLRLKLWGEHVKVALHGATPFFVERVCFSLYTALAPTTVVMLAGLSAAATYSIADKAMMFLGSLASPVCQTMMPVLTRAAKQENFASWRIPVLISAATVGFCGGMALIVYLTAGFAIQLVLPTYEAAMPVAQIFCLAAFVSSITVAVANFILVPRNAARILIWSAMCSLCVSLLLQFELIPKYGAVGGAYARLGAEVVTAIILTVRTVALFRASRRRPLEATYT